MNNIKRKKKKRADWTKRGNLKHIHLVCDDQKKFGFTISGHQPSIIKSIVYNSPAFLAGLRSGDFLISVNGQNVYDKTHDEIVALISLESDQQLHIVTSDNFLSGSSDEDFASHSQIRSKSKFKSSPVSREIRKSAESLSHHHLGATPKHSYTNSLPHKSSDSASNFASTSLNLASELINHEKVSFRVVVGYLGTIDGIIPNEQVTPINCCIRKLRQEKRNPLLVLMNILPWNLNLSNNDGVILATYSSERIIYCCSSTDSERKYFGLVTSNSLAATTSSVGDARKENSNSNSSCHVFFIDPKLRDHEIHNCIADKFNFTCSKDIVSNSCLEFQNSDYICKLINGMYNIKCDRFCASFLPKDQNCVRNNCRRGGNNSCRPHESRETLMSPNGDTTTASSNSDSGIGQYDCTNISDRILVVDFHEHYQQRRSSFTERSRPLGIVNDMQLQSSNMMRSLKNLNISTNSSHHNNRESFYQCGEEIENASQGSSTIGESIEKRSCDNLLTEEDAKSLESQNKSENDNFLIPTCKPKKAKKRSLIFTDNLSVDQLNSNSCELYQSTSLSTENLSSSSKQWSSKDIKGDIFANWGSMLELREHYKSSRFIDGAYSEPSLNKNFCEMDPHSDCNNYSKQNTLDSRVGGKKDKCAEDQQQNHRSKGVKPWSECFENLLNDPIGLNIFCEFLKREYSCENIYFWTACERYKQTVDLSERKKVAMNIFDSYLADGSREPVNVDEKAKLKTQEKLMSTSCADLDLFDNAQRQIFNLMKFDSYTRFIRSDLYKSCVEAESHNQQLPHTDQLDPKLDIHVKENGKSTKTEKLSSRKSLLSWHRRRSRYKSNTNEKMKDSESKESLNNLHRRELESSRSSLSSFDAAISKVNDDEIGNSLCRLILSNGVTTIVQIKPNETIRTLVDRLLEKRGMKYNAYDVMFQGTTKTLDVDGQSTQLSGNEVLIEQRIAFKIDLPNKKVISVKSRTNKILSDVLRPILQKYEYNLDSIKVFVKFYDYEPLELDVVTNVEAIDGQRLYVMFNDVIDTKEGGETSQNRVREPVKFIRVKKSALDNVNSLDEITNKVFCELLVQKYDTEGQQIASENGEHIEQGSIKSSNWGSETSGIFNRIRLTKKLRRVSSASASSSRKSFGDKGKVLAKIHPGAKLQSTKAQEEEFLEELKRAQKFRLEDQRGTKINIELPDFLKVNERMSNTDYLKATQTYSPTRSFSYTEKVRCTPNFKAERSESMVKLTTNTSPNRSDNSGDLNASIQCLPSQTPNKNNNNSIYSNNSPPQPNNRQIDDSFVTHRKFKVDERVPPLPPKPTKLAPKPSFNIKDNQETSTQQIPWSVAKERWYSNKRPDEITPAKKNPYIDHVKGSFV